MAKLVWGLCLLIGCTNDQNFSEPGELVFPPIVAKTESDIIHQKDTFHNPILKPADFYFIIDKSGSMADDVNAMMENIPDFFATLQENNIDYRVGLTTTDNYKGTAGELSYYLGERYVTVATPDPVAQFMQLYYNLLTLGIEAGIDAAYYGLTINHLDNDGFFRDRAPLYIITISDEEDQSEHTPDDLVWVLNRVESLKGAQVYYNAIVHTRKGYTVCPAEMNSDVLGWRYINVAMRTRGTAQEICAQDWQKTLTDLALYSTQDVIEYPLSDLPIEETIEVHVIRDEITFTLFPDEWVYSAERNSISLVDFDLTSEDVIEVDYDIMYQ